MASDVLQTWQRQSHQPNGAVERWSVSFVTESVQKSGREHLWRDTHLLCWSGACCTLLGSTMETTFSQHTCWFSRLCRVSCCAKTRIHSICKDNVHINLQRYEMNISSSLSTCRSFAMWSTWQLSLWSKRRERPNESFSTHHARCYRSKKHVMASS